MRVLHRKLRRDIQGAWGQSVAVGAVVLCGVAVYVAMASAYRNLEQTRDAYYAQYRFADFFISMERAPNTAGYRIEGIPGVREVRCRIVKDVNLDVEGAEGPRTGRIISMPDRPSPVLNDIVLLSGRYFEAGAWDEVVLSDAFAKANGLRTGDSLRASIENRKHTLRIVGTALSPEYVYTIPGGQSFIPDAKAFGILWVPRTFAEQSFGMTGACNDIVGTVDDPGATRRILDQAERLLRSYGVFTTVARKDQISNTFLSSEIQGLGVTARVLPAIFLGVAALVLLVLLNRMVRQERTQIGLLKAYGYSNAAVASHYIEFALLLGLAGAVGGCIVGQVLAGWLTRVYRDFFSFPILRAEAHPGVVLRAILLSAFFASFGALGAARRAVAIDPAEAMRPEAPRRGARSLVERSRAVWSRLSFTSKMIVRNVARYRARAVFTVLGVAMSVALLLIGGFSTDAMDFLIRFQFDVTQREDVRLGLAHEHGKDAWHEIRRLAHVRRAEPLLVYPFELRHGASEKKTAVTGLLPESGMYRLVDTGGESIAVGDAGLVVDEKLASELGVAAGDVVTMEPLLGRVKGEKRAVVSKVVRQYLGSGAYMNIEALSRILDEPFALNAALLQTERGEARTVARNLEDVAAVTSVGLREDAYRNLRDTLAASMWASNIIVAVFAGVIAFAIIYNSTTVSLMERRREMASLRVLGFSQQEVGRILYRENALLSALGILFGLPLGVLLCRALVEAYDTEAYRFPFYFSPWTFVYTVGMTALFVLVANLAVYRRVKRLDLVEVLKGRE